MSFIRRDLTERFQHEFSFMHFHMRNTELRVFYYQIIIKNNIQIQCAGTPAQDSFPASLLFDLVKLFQKFIRRQERPELQTAVQKIVLIRHAVRRSFDESGDFFYRASPDRVLTAPSR